MEKLYRKHELGFAIGWIIVYVVGSSAAGAASDAMGLPSALTFLLQLAMTLLLLGWLSKSGRLAEYGLCRPKHPAARMLYYLPLAAVASCNFWQGIHLQHPPLEALCYVGSMLLVGFLEELIFRGLLFRAMARDDLKAAFIVTAVTFGIGHIVNLVNGSGASLLATLCQIVSAVAFGFLFAVLYYRGGSLWPCILCHSILNACSVFAPTEPTPAATVLTSAVLTVIAAGYTLYLQKHLPAPDTF